MDKAQSQRIIRDTFESRFDKARFTRFIVELLNLKATKVNDASVIFNLSSIPNTYQPYINSFEKITDYKSGEATLDVLVIRLNKETSIERARTMQRNFIAWYLGGGCDGEQKEAALAAFVSPDENDWRFSLIKMDYSLVEDKKGAAKVIEQFSPAKRWSFLVGSNEKSHTAQAQLVDIFEMDEVNITLAQLEEAFNVEKVTKEFFTKYRELFFMTKEALDKIISKDNKIKSDFEEKNIDTTDFAKKLLGQIVFLYFLQKKGWFGVAKDAEWGTGPKNFLRALFEAKQSKFNNFFNDILEPLFYEALRTDRSYDDNYYSRFNCKIPFLNGGLFDPINNYDWVHTDIRLPNELFSNSYKTNEGDTGTGILDMFDRYNFTVQEDEPLEKEVAVDPEMLGKVFENLLEVKDRKSKGTYYTPREVVHYMCQQSLINYLATDLEDKVRKEDIETLIKYSEHIGVDVDSVEELKLDISPEIAANAIVLDEWLASVKVCDPAVGSGAFLVGMMSEIIRTRNILSGYLNGTRNIYDFKRDCIEKCLYGVDIDPGAVEICKLRLWLSLIVDEEDIRNIKPLPNLDYKIVCGNSLLNVELNLFNQEAFNGLEKIKPIYFSETDLRKKQEYKRQIDELIFEVTNGHKEFDFEVYFSEVFHENKGFDIVIANPPYIDYRKIDSITKSAIKGYKVAQHSRMINLYNYFFEKGINLLSDGGALTFISPQQYLILDNCRGLRDIIRENTVVVLSDFARVKLFDASTYPFVSIIMKSVKSKSGKYFEFDQVANLDQPVRYIEINNPISEPVNISGHRLLLSKIESAASTKVKDIAEIFCASSSTALDVSTKPSDGPVLLTASDIKNWTVELPRRFVKLKSYGDNSARKQHGDIIYTSRMTRRIRAAFIKENKFLGGKINVVKVKNINPLFLTALLNSNLINFWYREKYSMQHMQGGALPVNTPELEKIPIMMNDSVAVKIIVLVDKILAITRDNDYLGNSAKQTKVCEYENQINQMVYELYGLTPEEIEIVENSAKK